MNGLAGAGGDASGGAVYATGGLLAVTYNPSFNSDAAVRKFEQNTTKGGGGSGANAGTSATGAVSAGVGGGGGSARGGGLYVDVPTGGSTPTITDTSTNSNATFEANGATGCSGGGGGAGLRNLSMPATGVFPAMPRAAESISRIHWRPISTCSL